jgi:outer membrane protein assembly factor BamD
MKSIFAILCLVIVASCSNYNQVLKSDDYEAKFNEANHLFEDKKFDRCVALYEQVYQRSPKSPQGEISYYRMGKACYNVQDWYLASYYLASFQTKFPYSNLVEETVFLAAICAVENSPEASLDQNETELALNELQGFISRYPNSEHVDTCNVIMDKLRFKLQTKEVLNVRLYARTQNYRAATVTAHAFLDNYPVSIYREEMRALLVRNYYLLTINSIESKLEERIEKTLESYEDLLAEFPNSTYLREFENIRIKLAELKTPKTK